MLSIGKYPLCCYIAFKMQLDGPFVNHAKGKSGGFFGGPRAPLRIDVPLRQSIVGLQHHVVRSFIQALQAREGVVAHGTQLRMLPNYKRSRTCVA